ncbi:MULTISPECIES: zinc dependent phospholipase C family protein [Clostridium]|uniref:Zinc dependent phospholipase C family protein n=1 Tax=Clostridium cibarium TaxID=2762247 RepID=A0ABR8PXQ6_9CLOT|nr:MULTISPECIES: zinc dependent phospholipase C family protein [Clostridium]MBD7912929.1 zinc dependent phospholipase C family protein [Clostridium cibarium]
MNTHKILANNILRQTSIDKLNLIDKKKFIWGNVKPDYVSKYKLKKHFYDESINMILEKVHFLSSLTSKEIFYSYGIKKFSAELGVVCHFLCDFFCYAHSERWRLKSDLKKHVSYEQKLSKIAKDFNFVELIDENLLIEDIEMFIKYNMEEYSEVEGYEKDLLYSAFICNSIVNSVLNQVIENEEAERRVG